MLQATVVEVSLRGVQVDRTALQASLLDHQDLLDLRAHQAHQAHQPSLQHNPGECMLRTIL